MFNGIRDTLSSSAVKSMLASKISRYCKLTDLRIRSKERTIHAELWLEGDPSPVTVDVLSYRIEGSSSAPLLTISEARVSRPWMEQLVRDTLIDRPLPIPTMALFVLGGIDSETPAEDNA